MKISHAFESCSHIHEVSSTMTLPGGARPSSKQRKWIVIDVHKVNRPTRLASLQNAFTATPMQWLDVKFERFTKIVNYFSHT